VAIYVAVSCRPAGLKPNGTHFVNFESQCANMRAGFVSDYKPASPYASELRLKVNAIRRKANGNDCIRRSCMVAFSEKCRIPPDYRLSK